VPAFAGAFVSPGEKCADGRPEQSRLLDERKVATAFKKINSAPDHHRGRGCDGADRSAARYEAPNRAAAFFTSFGATQKIAP